MKEDFRSCTKGNSPLARPECRWGSIKAYLKVGQFWPDFSFCIPGPIIRHSLFYDLWTSVSVLASPFSSISLPWWSCKGVYHRLLLLKGSEGEMSHFEMLPFRLTQ